MDYDEIINELECWVDETVETLQDDEENYNLNLEDLKNLHIDKFEHAFIIRHGSKHGDFPRLAGSYLTNEYYILQSGEMRDKLVIGDSNAKIPFDIEQITYKYLLEDLMKDCKKGYILNEVGTEKGQKYKITVEKL